MTVSAPDHDTVNCFRSKKFKDILEDVFSKVVKLLVDSGRRRAKDINADGTWKRPMPTAIP